MFCCSSSIASSTRLFFFCRSLSSNLSWARGVTHSEATASFIVWKTSSSLLLEETDVLEKILSSPLVSVQNTTSSSISSDERLSSSSAKGTMSSSIALFLALAFTREWPPIILSFLRDLLLALKLSLE